MSRLIDLTGQTFGYLTVIKRVENKKKRKKTIFLQTNHLDVKHV